jgi:hypothetical protein
VKDESENGDQFSCRTLPLASCKSGLVLRMLTDDLSKMLPPTNVKLFTRHTLPAPNYKYATNCIQQGPSRESDNRSTTRHSLRFLDSQNSLL